uniref:Translocation protein TolB n=1 Tax=Heterorhabditis bacteriophora TaxID=37862 RepID=A0A1I7X560_HETBA
METPYGSWRSQITPDLFSKGNCKAICELIATDSGVFWVEQNFNGRRELYFCHEGINERIRWAAEQSVQNSVHEYGGGSFMPLSDGSVIYTTVEGVYIQKSHSDIPIQLVNSNNNMLRFADFTASDNYVFCVNENHKSDGNPENQLISINRNTKEKNVVVSCLNFASGADFYASPRISPNGKKLVWMQWNHNNMPWDETSIHIARVLEDGTVTNEIKMKDGNGKNASY